MKKGNKLFISCERAVQYCTKAQYNEISFYEKITLKLHILICKICKLYTKKNTKLSQLLKDDKVHCLPPDLKLKMDIMVKKELLESPRH